MHLRVKTQMLLRNGFPIWISLQLISKKNLTHLLQPLDLTTNATFKNIERREFSNYFTSTILNELTEDPTLDVTTISVDLRLSTSKLIRLEMLKKICNFFRREDGKNIIKAGFRA